MQLSLEIILWLLLGFGVPGLLCFVLLCFPREIVRWQGKFYKRAYKDISKLSDEQIDQRYQLPTDRMLMGRRSEFIRQASENPEQYQSLISIYRRMGLALLLMLGIALGFLLIAISSGALQ